MTLARTLAPGQRCLVHVTDVVTGQDRIVHETTEVLLEAPNWTVEDRLVLNGDGVLWQMPSDGSAPPRVIHHQGLPELNNDHVLDPDGVHVHVSGNDGQLHRAPLAGGRATRTTRERLGEHGQPLLHFLHGISPDGATLAYVNLDPQVGFGVGANIHLVASDGSDDRELLPGWGPDDGPEFTPDGQWIHFNTERFSPGQAQIARVRPDGSELEQLTFDERVNWFPHCSPDGSRWSHVSFPPGTQGHPADLVVRLMLVEDDDWRGARCLAELPGGQGTLNVNSWSPDSRRLAWVSYPFD
ncbi:biopolymer transporter Tol [Luteococcus peritonei]|uniref:TolB family protein n=1 Tax=Luteococcus peritonei TaxID=88874 RepID=A0ABW4RVS3_9ACTN